MTIDRYPSTPTPLRVIIDENSQSIGLVFKKDDETHALWLHAKMAYSLGAHLMAMGASMEFGENYDIVNHEWPLKVSGHVKKGEYVYCGVDNPLEAIGRYCAETGASPLACAVEVGER